MAIPSLVVVQKCFRNSVVVLNSKVLSYAITLWYSVRWLSHGIPSYGILYFPELISSKRFFDTEKVKLWSAFKI